MAGYDKRPEKNDLSDWFDLFGVNTEDIATDNKTEEFTSNIKHNVTRMKI